MSDATQPTKEQLDQARRAGFDAHSTHLPEDVRVGMAQKHVELSNRREKNIKDFRNGVLSSRR